MTNHPAGSIATADPTFRTSTPEVVTDRHGRHLTMMTCWTLEGGRWEPFETIRKDDR